LLTLWAGIWQIIRLQTADTDKNSLLPLYFSIPLNLLTCII